ncbi:putative transcription factor WD40-like family [Helianthus annuus]|uniref:Transcription factor WD40-like family n=2 Tax=Helianthus annuus TaxID=4232 RepID=A0A9K3DKQ6_HELAN|nr:putative transcription factor WD40-like family [Helianthus annuus]
MLFICYGNGSVTSVIQVASWRFTAIMATFKWDFDACFALSKNDPYVMSASGGKISLFNMMTFKVTVFLLLKASLKDKRMSGLSFSHVLNVLVSSGVNAQIRVWSSDGWEKQKTRYVQLPPGRTPSPQSDTRVQFHHDQTHFLLWIQRENSALISHATFSCDSELIYASFCVFNASHLRLRCKINPFAYLTSNLNVHPMVIAAHPQEPNQLALGLSDGTVHVLEPLESDGRWGVPPSADNGSTRTVPATPPAAGSGSEQPA